MTREERIAVQNANIARKVGYPYYPTSADMLYRKPAILRQMTFQNLRFVAETRLALLRGEIEERKVQEAKTLIIAGLGKARRNGDSAKHTGCNLHRI